MGLKSFSAVQPCGRTGSGNEMVTEAMLGVVVVGKVEGATGEIISYTIAGADRADPCTPPRIAYVLRAHQCLEV
jgi:hypothetical protein